MTRSGAQILGDQLERHRAEIAFGVPGESYLAVLDALHDAAISLVVSRHEAGAANMARPTASSRAGRGSASSPAGRARRT